MTRIDLDLCHLSCCISVIKPSIPVTKSTLFAVSFTAEPARAGNTASGFLKLLAKACKPPEVYGKRNIKRLSNGNLPVGCKSWPCEDVPDVLTAKRIRALPPAPFAAKVLEDHPGLTLAEAKIVA